MKSAHAAMVAAAKQGLFEQVLDIYHELTQSFKTERPDGISRTQQLPTWVIEAPITLIAANAHPGSPLSKSLVHRLLGLAPEGPLKEPLASVLVKLAMSAQEVERAVDFKTRAETKKLRTFTPLLMAATTADSAYAELKTLGLEPTQAEFVHAVKNVSDFTAVLTDAVRLFETVECRELVEAIHARAVREKIEAAVVNEDAFDPQALGLTDEELEKLVTLSSRLLAASAGEVHVSLVQQQSAVMVERLLSNGTPGAVWLIDGANVAHTNQNFSDGRFSFAQIDEVRHALVATGDVCKVFLHSKWLKADANLRMNLELPVGEPKAKRRKPLPRLAEMSEPRAGETCFEETVNQDESNPFVVSWKTSGELCVVPPRVNDDWYWLLACVLIERELRRRGVKQREVCVVSNDLMRDHLFRMDVAERTWRRFIHRHVCRFKISFPPESPETRLYQFQKPPVVSRLSQVQAGVFVFPTEGGRWLVVKTPCSCMVLCCLRCMDHISPILVDKVASSRYFRERVFGLNEIGLIDRVMHDVLSVGILYGPHSRPTPFLCLLVHLLQIKADVEAVKYFLTLTEGVCTDDANRRKDMRYLRVLGAFYLRLCIPGSPDLYSWLEPLLADRRQLNVVHPNGESESLPMDTLIDLLLAQKSQVLFGLTLPVIVRRFVHEKRRKLDVYRSFLTDITEAEILHARRELAELDEQELSNFSSISLTIDETQALRAKLGLKPLRV